MQATGGGQLHDLKMLLMQQIILQADQNKIVKKKKA